MKILAKKTVVKGDLITLLFPIAATSGVGWGCHWVTSHIASVLALRSPTLEGGKGESFLALGWGISSWHMWYLVTSVS